MNAAAARSAAVGGAGAGKQCGFVLVNGPDIVDKFIGGSGEKIRGVFKKAREVAAQKGSCILFIDEIGESEISCF